MSESQLVNQCIRYLFSRGCYVWRNNTGSYKKGPHWIRYGLTGSGDILGLTPGGVFLSCECKVGYNKQEPAQETFQQRIEEKNGIYILAYSVEDVAKVIDNLQ